MALQVYNPSQWNPSLKGNLALAMDGDLYEVQNAHNSWSLSSPDDNTLRFEVRSGDVFSFDSSNPNPDGYLSQRSEIADKTIIPNGDPLNISYKFELEPGAPNTALWTVLGQLHQDNYPGAQPWSPPFEIKLVGETMVIDIHYNNAQNQQVEQVLYTDVANIQRGHTYDLNITAVVDPSGGGRLVVTRDGVQIVNYSGPLGYTQEGGVYWKEGIYRAGNATETIAADYSNLAITTGSAVTVPTADSFIAAPVLSVNKVTSTSGNTQTVLLSGTAKGNTTVSIYEGNVLLGHALANSNGAFSLSVSVPSASETLLSAIATDSSGRNGLMSGSTAIETGTAADIISRMGAIANQNVGAIVLTDSSVLPVTAAQLNLCLGAYKSTVAKIQGSYSYLETATVTGQSYNTQTFAVTSAGVLTEQKRYSGSTLVFDNKIASDGSQTLMSANTYGGFDVSSIAPDGFLTGFTRSNASVTTLVQSFNRDGSKTFYNYDPTTGNLANYAVTQADKSGIAVTVGIKGQNYVTQVFSTDSTGKVVLQERLTAGGTVTFISSVGSGGQTEVQNFDPTTGKETNFTITNADGSVVQGVYGITGKPYTSQITTYDKTKKIVSQTTSNDLGPVATVPANVAATLLLAGLHAVPATASVAKQNVTMNGDGSYSVVTYAAGSASVIANTQYFSKSGTLQATDLYNASGKKVSTSAIEANGTLVTTYDLASGLRTSTTQTTTDAMSQVTTFQAGSDNMISSVKTYSATGSLLELDVYNASGQLTSTSSVGVTGTALTAFDPTSGQALNVTLTKADGSSVVTAFTTTALISSVQCYDAAGHLVEADFYNSAGKKTASTMLSNDGSKIVANFSTTTGAILTVTTTNTDGSHSLATYQTGSAGLLSSVKNYSASNALVDNTTYDLSGQKTQSIHYNADSSKTVTSYGLVNRYYVEQSTTYDATSRMIGAARWYGDSAHTLAFSATFNSDGSSQIINYDTAGRETVRQNFAADGSRDVLSSTYSSASALAPSSTQDVLYSAGNKVLSIDTATVSGSYQQAAVASGQVLTSHTGALDTFTGASSGGTSFVFKPAFGQDIITNFKSGAGAWHDTVDLSALHLGNGSTNAAFDLLAQSLKQVGADAVLSIAPTEAIVFKNTTVAALKSDYFRV